MSVNKNKKRRLISPLKIVSGLSIMLILAGVAAAWVVLRSENDDLSKALANTESRIKPFATEYNFDVNTASFLGGAANDQAAAVDIQGDGTVVVAGKIDPESQNFGQNPVLLTAGSDTTPGGTGVLVRFQPDGKSLKSISRLGGIIQDMGVSSDNSIYLLGDFGLAKLNSSADQVLWSKSLDQIGGNGASGRKLDVSKNGTVGVLLQNATASAAIRIYDTTGIQKPLVVNPTETLNSDIVVDENNGLVITTGYKQVNSTLQTPFIKAYNYSGSSTSPIWRSYDYNSSEITSLNLGADTRGVGLGMGLDGKLYFIGSTDGGNNIFTREEKSISQAANHNITFDSYNQMSNLNSGKFTYYARINPATGVIEKGQYGLTRNSSGKGSSMTPKAITAGQDGTVYLVADAAFQVEGRSQIQISGQPVGAYNGDGILLVISADFMNRDKVASWQNGGRNSMVGVSYKNGQGAILSNSDSGDLLTVNSLQSARAGGIDMFYSVWGVAPLSSSSSISSSQSLSNTPVISSSQSSTSSTPVSSSSQSSVLASSSSTAISSSQSSSTASTVSSVSTSSFSVSSDTSSISSLSSASTISSVSSSSLATISSSSVSSNEPFSSSSSSTFSQGSPNPYYFFIPRDKVEFTPSKSEPSIFGNLDLRFGYKNLPFASGTCTFRIRPYEETQGFESYSAKLTTRSVPLNGGACSTTLPAQAQDWPRLSIEMRFTDSEGGEWGSDVEYFMLMGPMAVVEMGVSEV